eukprot:g3420.t1
MMIGARRGIMHVVRTSMPEDLGYTQSIARIDHVNFRLGQPSPKILAKNRDLILSSLRRDSKEKTPPIHELALQYGHAQGKLGFRQDLAKWMQRQFRGLRSVSPHALMVTNGNSHATNFLFRNFVSSGDIMVVDDPCYFIVSGAVLAVGAKPMLIPTDPRSGFDVEALETLIATIEKKGERLKAVYLSSPFYHNPTGASMSDASAKRLCDLSAKHRFYVFADEPYSMMSFEPNKMKTLKEFDTADPNESRVVSYHSFSKFMGPGLRLGWLHAGSSVISKLIQDNVIDSGGGHNPLVSELVHLLLKNGDIDRALTDLNKLYEKRAGRLVESISKYFGDKISFETPSGGYFLWCRFTDDTNVDAFHKYIDNSKKYRVNFLEGSKCKISAVPGMEASRFEKHIRLSWAFYEEDEIEEGIRRLHQAHAAFLSEAGGRSCKDPES